MDEINPPEKILGWFHDIKFYFAGIIRIISSSESEQNDRAASQSFFMVPNVSPRQFFGFHTKIQMELRCGFLMNMRFLGGESTLNELRNFLKCPLGIIWVSRTSSVSRGMQRTSNRIRTTHQSFFIPIVSIYAL